MLDNILITGGSGMVGNNIKFGMKPSSEEMNITDLKSIKSYINVRKKVSCIIHLAALNLRDCENNSMKAINVNINGTLNMLSIAKKMSIPFVYISTGAVFSSKNNNMKFDETNIVCPNSVYGYTKVSGENIVLSYDKTILIRTGWLFGGNQKSHYKFVEHTINNLYMNTKISASNDFYGSPTYVKDFIGKMKELILSQNYGIHHVINEGVASGYDIAYQIADILQNNSLIEKMSCIDIPNAGPDRSRSEILICKDVKNYLRPWKDALNEYVTSYLENIDLCKTQITMSKNITNKIYWKNRNKCRLCNSTDILTFLKLKPTPLANHFLSLPKRQERLPLDVCICNNCKHIQLIQIVDPQVQYIDYPYVFATSEIMVRHLEDSINYFVEHLELSKTDNILEIGANDGTGIMHLIKLGFENSLGIDPAKNLNDRHELPIFCEFFGSNNKYIFGTKSFKLIYGFHCCAHIEDIQDVFKTVYDLLEENGVFIMEVGYFYEVIRNNSFDTIYHEHIDYHTCRAISNFSTKYGLKLYHVKETSIQGGSMQFFFSKNENIAVNESVVKSLIKEDSMKLHSFDTLSNFKNKIFNGINDISIVINGIVGAGKKIAGFGASAKSTTFLHQFLNKGNNLEYIIDDNIYKQNLLSPGFHIPIKPLNILDIEHVDYVIILSWNFATQLIKKLEPYRKTGLRVIVPFPELIIL
jgi:dTDP-4-dehydrorhamnose reductase